MNGEKEKKKRKILITMITGYGVGGVERYCSNMLENMDLTAYDVTYFTPQGIFDHEGADELRNLGIDMRSGNLSLPSESAPIKEKLEFHIRTILKFRKICKEKSFDIIHVNTGSIIYQAYMMLFARLFGIKRRISHSHNAEFTQHYAGLRKMVVLNATDLLSCSIPAAKCLFGEKYAKKAIIMKNGIDLGKYMFSSITRAEYRKKLGILETDFVIGHVGALRTQKNHKFLVEIFKAIADKETSAKLLLVGAGGLETEIRAQVNNMGLKDRVIFAGLVHDTENYYCTMDVFAMPSLFEGLPFVGIEAQASGLPCFFSNQIAMEVKVTENVQFLPIQDPNLWADKILSAKPKTISQRENAWIAVKDAGYDVKDCAAKLEKIYSSGS